MYVRFTYVTIFSMIDSVKPIPVNRFGEHVQHMHADRDKWFEMKYDVNYHYTIASCNIFQLV